MSEFQKVVTQSSPSSTKASTNWVSGFVWVIAMWLLSRLLIVVTMQLIAPLLDLPPVNYSPPFLGFVPNFIPKTGWELFAHWDGAWYRKIATLGYDYANDGQQYPVAFFPLFPLFIRGVMTLGIPFEVAGTLVNNLAFLGALLLVYSWLEERHGISAAKWATAVMAWCPLSLYGTVIYTEGLFLLLTTAALRAFDKHQYTWAALWGAMATATRVTGAALVPAFLLVSWREKRPPIAYATGFIAGTGLLLFSMYCLINFGDPLAFFHVQRAWTQPSWLEILNNALALKPGSLLKVSMLLGGGYLLWYLRSKLPHIVVAYGFCALAMLVASGGTSSFHRYVYGIVSVSLALGVLLVRNPRWGYALIGVFIILLIDYAIEFAWWLWVA